MKVKTTNYANTAEVLKYAEHYIGVAVMVSDTGVTVNSDGRKIVSAGTLVGGTASGAVSADNSATTEGVLLHDTDVTYGNAPGTMVIHGFIDLTKIPAAPSSGAKTALPQITFM